MSLDGKAETIRVNGAERALNAERIAELLDELGCAEDRRGVAVAVNGAVVPRSEWPQRILRPGDEVEVVGAVQGG